MNAVTIDLLQDAERLSDTLIAPIPVSLGERDMALAELHRDA